MCQKEEEKKTSKAKKFWCGLGLTTLAVLAGVAIYDHRNQIVSGAKSTASWAKNTFNKAKDSIKAQKQ